MADTALRCGDCEEFFDEPAGPLYECSRCGGQHLEDEVDARRCPDCNIFMAKVADEVCPECREEGFVEVEVVVVNGERYVAGERTIAEIEEEQVARAAQREESRKKHEERMDNYRREKEEKLARRIELVAAAEPIIRDRCPELEDYMQTWRMFEGKGTHLDSEGFSISWDIFGELLAVLGDVATECEARGLAPRLDVLVRHLANGTAMREGVDRLTAEVAEGAS